MLYMYNYNFRIFYSMISTFTPDEPIMPIVDTYKDWSLGILIMELHGVVKVDLYL